MKAIQFIDPADLHEHAILRNLPLLAKDDPRFEKLVDDVMARGGLIEPLKITAANRIVDGRHRWRAAKRAGLTTVPCLVVAEEEVAGIVLATLVHRRHFTKSALAYLAYPLIKPAHEETRAAHLERLKSGNHETIGHSVPNGRSSIDFAEQIGVSRKMFDYAAKVHDIFDADAEFKAEMEPKILDTEQGVGLGAVIAGYAGRSVKQDHKRPTKQLDLFTDAIEDLTVRFTYWEKFDDTQKHSLTPLVRKAVAEMPADLRKEFSKALKAVEREEHS